MNDESNRLLEIEKNENKDLKEINLKILNDISLKE